VLEVVLAVGLSLVYIPKQSGKQTSSQANKQTISQPTKQTTTQPTKYKATSPICSI
jgi:hypothetical protein